MPVSTTPPVLTALPPPPLPTDAEAVFDTKAGASLTAQVVMVTEVNTALAWQAGATADTLAYKNAASDSATAANSSKNAAAQSAIDATNNGAEQVDLAAEQAALAASNGAQQVALAAEQVALATSKANNAASSASSAQASAAAAGAAAGLPSLVGNAGKVLSVNPAGAGVLWADVGQKIGDTLFSARSPGATYLPLNGGVYSQTAYAALFGIVGLISGSFAETWAAVTSNAGSNAISAVESDGNGVWVAAGAAGAMVRSTDNGVTWTAVTSGFGATAINGLACDRANVWIAVGAAGNVTRSTDNGATWAAVTSGKGASDTIQAVTCDRNATFIASFVNGSNGLYGVIRSTNKGVSWTSVTIANSSGASNKLIVTDRKGVWLYSEFSGFYKSTDLGATWVSVGSLPSGVGRFATDCAGVWVATTSTSGSLIYRSTDNGTTWNSSGTTSPLVSSAIATDERGTWIAGGASTLVFRSTNNGYTWTAVLISGLTGGPLGIAFGKDGVAIAAGAAGAVRRSFPTYGYDTATQFKLPDQPAAIGLAAYIKAKDA